MQKGWIKVILIAFLLISYINRGIFIFAPETEYTDGSSSEGEINSVVELLISWIGNEYNDLDEDGDVPSHNMVKEIKPFTYQKLAQIEFHINWNFNTNRFIPINEIIIFTPIYDKIDHPPKNFC